MRGLCAVCKGSRLLCGLKSCPILNAILRRQSDLSEDFFGPSTSVFIGRMGYPQVGVGPLTVVQDHADLELSVAHPAEWLAVGIPKLVELRGATLRARKPEHIGAKSGFISDLRELAMAERPTDVELRFGSKPVFKFSFSEILPPTGATVRVENMRVVENPRIPKKVERIVTDDLKAVEAVNMLYDTGMDVYKLSEILSAGILGRNRSKKLVPTRWSITATDDIVFRYLASKLKEYPPLDSFLVYESVHLGNRFVILLLPSLFEFENFEIWFSGSVWSMGKSTILEEYEAYNGRKRYAADEGGGYYAARLAVAEALSRMGRQAGVVVFREIEPSYVLPLGVWVVRETMRDAFRRRAEKFQRLEEALTYINSRLISDIEVLKAKSRIIGQRRLDSYWR